MNNKDEDKIRKAFASKDWNDIKMAMKNNLRALNNLIEKLK